MRSVMIHVGSDVALQVRLPLPCSWSAVPAEAVGVEESNRDNQHIRYGFCDFRSHSLSAGVQAECSEYISRMSTTQDRSIYTTNFAMGSNIDWRCSNLTWKINSYKTH